jgi:hypothetical protein
MLAGEYNHIPYIRCLLGIAKPADGLPPSGTVKNDGAVYLGLLGVDDANLRLAEDTWRSLGPRMLMWSQGGPTQLEGLTASIIR